MKKLLFILFLFGVIAFQVNAQKDTTKRVREYDLPVVSLSETELEEEDGQDISGLLQSSKDIFTSTAGYTFGRARFKIRGLNSEHTTVMMNGVSLNDVESGRPYWSVWGGLNDVTRNKEIIVGIAANPYGISSLGGYTNIIAQASKFRKGTKLVYSSANKSYRNRAMITHSTGMMKNGFAVTISASRRWANEGYAPGTFYDAYSYFLAIEKQFSEKHSLNLVLFNAPKRAGSSGHSIQDAYDLSGTNYYNPNWGWQSGKKRNARISTYNQPKLILTDFYTLNNKTKINTSLAFSLAKAGKTKLSWYGRTDPRPDYYRNMPYFREYDTTYYDDYVYKWDNTDGQILWEKFYSTNSRSTSEFEGDDGNKLKRALYMVEEEHNDYIEFVFHNNITHELNENIKLNGGINILYHNGSHYKTATDLLGADFWLDIDKFSPEGQKDSDIRNPNRRIGVNDRFGYDYQSVISKQALFGNANFSYSKIDFFLSANVEHINLYRIGNMQNGKFPNNSLGASDKINNFDYSLLGGIVYKISGRHFISANGAYISRSPLFKESFTSSRTQNKIVSGLTNKTIKSFDINYIIRYPKFKSRLTYYYSDFNNDIEQRYMYLDYTHEFVNSLMTGIHKVHTGIELASEYEVVSGLTLFGVYASSLNLYQNHPKLSLYIDNYKNMFPEMEAYISGYHSGQGPETIGSLGLKYWSSNYWFGGFSLNYMDDIYINIAHTKYTSKAISFSPENMADVGTPYYDELLSKLKDYELKQEKVDPGYTIDMFVGKSWRIKYKYYINLSLNISNILDNQNIITGGYDAYRMSSGQPDRYKAKYFYLYGRQYFLNLSFRF